MGIAEPNRAVARRSPAAVGVPVNQRCKVVVCLSMLLLGRCDRLGCTLSGVGVVLLVVRMAVLAHDRQVHGQKTSCDSPDAKSVGGVLHWAGSRRGAAMLAQQPSADSTYDALSEDALAVLIGGVADVLWPV